MLGLGSLNRALNNISKAAELQTQVLVVQSAKSVADSMTNNKVSAKDIKALGELSKILDDL